MAELEGQVGTGHKIVRIEAEALCERCRLVAIWLKNEEHEGHDPEELVIGHSSKCPLCLWLLKNLDPPIKEMGRNATIRFLKVSQPCYSSRKVPYLGWKSDYGFDYSHYYALPLDDGKSTKIREDAFRLIDRHNIDFDKLRHWIKYCRTNHGHVCSRNTQINRIQLGKEPVIKVIDCKQRMITAAALSVPYVALSYVWGTGVPGIVEEEPSPDGDLRNALPDSLPRTIEDAIFTTMQLGYRYLWVDKYCIDQCDPRELHAQLSLMNSIYQAASVTIVAASGADSNFGLPGVGERPRTPQSGIHLDGTTWVLARSRPEVSVLEAAWSTRAWTYQESFFSRRQIFFTDQQVLFECCEMSCCELVDSPLGKTTEIRWHITHEGNGDMSPAHGGKDLLRHIRKYTERSLTYQSDVLRAMQGIFSYFANPSIGEADRRLQFWGICISPNAYGARLPTASADEQLRMSLAQGLCWNDPGDQGYSRSRKRRDGFPSWSWSGWDMVIAWPYAEQGSLSPGVIPRAISLEKRDGARVPFTAALAEQLCTMSSEGADCTYRLHLQIEIMDIGVTYLHLEGIVGPYPSQNPWKYVVRAMAHETTSSSRRDNKKSSEEPDLSPQQTVYWPINITASIEEGSELHQRLCRDILKCVVLPNDHGLVVLAVGSIFERIGIMYLYGFLEEGPLDTGHITEYFPSSVQEIVLG